MRSSSWFDATHPYPILAVRRRDAVWIDDGLGPRLREAWEAVIPESRSSPERPVLQGSRHPDYAERMSDRLVEVRVEGFRVLKDVRLSLKGLTVLIGDNGVGKSSLLEIFEIGRKLSFYNNSLDLIALHHGALDTLIRTGADEARITYEAEGDEGPFSYSFAFGYQGTAVTLVSETLNEWTQGRQAKPVCVIARDRTGCLLADTVDGTPRALGVPPGQLAVARLGDNAPGAVLRAKRLLNNSSVLQPFDVRPLWVSRARQQTSAMRSSNVPSPVEGFDLAGENLANCYLHLLSSEDSRERVLERIQAGLGDHIVSVSTAAVGQGKIELRLHLRSESKPMAASCLSAGELEYLAFVALAEIESTRSVLSFDEPEAHLHPLLLVRVVWLLEHLSTSCPVLLATHSDRLLDALSNPAEQVVLCELDSSRSTFLSRPDPVTLAKWLERYRGLGAVRAEGYEKHLMAREVGS